MTALKVVSAAAITSSAAVVVLLQSAAAAPELTGAVLLSTVVLGLLMYVLRRVQVIPAEEGAKRHEVVNRITEAIGAAENRLDTALTRLEARLTEANTAGNAREAVERHRLEDRVLQLERWRPRQRREDPDT